MVKILLSFLDVWQSSLTYIFGLILNEVSQLVDFLFPDIYLKGFSYFPPTPIFYPLFLLYLSYPTLATAKSKFGYTKVK